MLWTTGRSSISGYFTLRTTSTIAADKDDNNSGSNATNEMSAADLSTQKACLGLLAADGGYYNETLDSTFRFADYYTDSFKNTNTHWEITNTGSGYGTLSFESWNASRSQTTSRFTDTTINLISKSTLGKGLFSLSWLQSARNAETADMNVVSLNLGIKGSPGSVVMGGYDAALIDFNNKAVFSKGTELPFAYYASMIRLNVNSGGVDINVLEDETKTIVDKVPNVGLTYDDFGIRLAQETIDKILPLVGNPVYDAGVNGYVYSGVPNTDWSFIFFLTNHTDPISIQIPASTLLATDSSTNDPLSSHNETGKTYLQLSPTADGSSNGQYLGRTFLQHAYLIDSNAPSTIGKFHLSALPTPLPVGKSLVAASLQSIHIFDSETEAIVPSKAPRAGPMVGGIVGGAFLLASTVFVSYWCIRRRKMRLKNSINTADLAKASLEKEIKLRHIVNLHHGGGGPARGVDNFSAGASSYRTTASIPIHYSPSLTRDV